MGKDGDMSEETAKEAASMDDLKKLESSLSGQMSSLESSMTGQMQELRDMMKQLLSNQTPHSTTESTTQVARVLTKPLNGFIEATKKTVGEEEVEGEDKSQKAGGSGDTKSQKDSGSDGNTAVPPPPWHSPNPPIPHPHIVHQGQPPKLEPTRFGYWQFQMISHICSSSIKLWRIIEQGFKPPDKDNLT
jgi:hypothetical protein